MSAQQSLANLVANCPLPNNQRLDDQIPEALRHWEGQTWFCLLKNVPEEDRSWDGNRSWDLIKRDDPMMDWWSELTEAGDHDGAMWIDHAMGEIDIFGDGNDGLSENDVINACINAGIEVIDAQYD